jgi:hypothetical protein
MTGGLPIIVCISFIRQIYIDAGMVIKCSELT